ncbi:MAG: hypothetical protein V4461_13185 [Pseudomonadota bacterium]
MQPDASTWTDIATAVAAIAALLISLVSLHYSRKGMVLAEAQDRRRQPKLLPEYLSGHFSTDGATGARTYHMQLAIRNPTDSDNAVARIELNLTYRLPDGTLITARVPPSNSGAQGTSLSVPQRVGAHETIAGWCAFAVDAAVIANRHIEGYMVELNDSHGQLSSVTPLILSERKDVR